MLLQFVRRVPAAAEVRSTGVEPFAHVREVLDGKCSSDSDEQGRTSTVIRLHFRPFV